jgi:osmotically inducible protein OsmC
MERQATARWSGDLKTGTGNLKTGSGVVDLPYSFTTRFEGTKGTNPEELLGAAHAGCFSMALGHALASAGHVATSIETTAKVTLDKVPEGFGITRIDLVTRGVVPGITAAQFQEFAEKTKTGCIVSRALAAVPMTLTATLG